VRERLGVPVLASGPATDEAVASKLGADGWAPDAEAAVTELDRLQRRPS
jgi:methanogenic corrinoid protein MtbC1